jgi:hypothetical protein
VLPYGGATRKHKGSSHRGGQRDGRRRSPSQTASQGASPRPWRRRPSQRLDRFPMTSRRGGWGVWPVEKRKGRAGVNRTRPDEKGVRLPCRGRSHGGRPGPRVVRPGATIPDGPGTPPRPRDRRRCALSGVCRGAGVRVVVDCQRSVVARHPILPVLSRACAIKSACASMPILRSSITKRGQGGWMAM